MRLPVTSGDVIFGCARARDHCRYHHLTARPQIWPCPYLYTTPVLSSFMIYHRVEDLPSPRFFICLRGVGIMFVVSCSNIRYDFRVKTMFDLPWISFVLHRVPVLFMLFVFIYVYWCPNLFPYQMMFELFNKQRRFSHMEQELPTLPEHLSAP